MISTVTTSTVSTVTTVALAGSIGLIGIVLLFTMLVQKDVTSSSSDKRLNRLGKTLNIAIIPLLIAFALIVVVKIGAFLK